MNLLDAWLLAHFVGDDDVLELQVVEALQTNTTLVVGLDFGGIVLETLERVDLAIVEDDRSGA